MADAATFTDCATGKRFMVANNAELERGYLAARGNSENQCYCQLKVTLRWRLIPIPVRRLKY